MGKCENLKIFVKIIKFNLQNNYEKTDKKLYFKKIKICKNRAIFVWQRFIFYIKYKCKKAKVLNAK